MVKLLYRLIYIVPIVLLGEGLIMNYLFESPVTVGECFLIVLFAAFIPILSRLGTQMKIIVTGGVLVVTAAVFFVAFRLDKSADHAGIYRELIIILAAVGLSAAGFLVAGVRALKILAAISFAAFLAVSMVLYYTVSGAEVWCALAFILPLVAEEVQRHFRRGGIL